MNVNVASSVRVNTDNDPITLQIIRHELIAIPNQIERNIERTAFSPLVQEYKDYSVGFVDPDGKLVAQSRGSLPIFVANALGTAVKHGLSIYGAGGMRDGDVVISNDPGTLGQHLNNVVAYTPVRIGRRPARLLRRAGALDRPRRLRAGLVPVDHHHRHLAGGRSVPDRQADPRGPAQRRHVPPDRRELALSGHAARRPRSPARRLPDGLQPCEGHRSERMASMPCAMLSPTCGALPIRLSPSALKKVPPGVYTASSFLDDDGVRLDRRVPVEVKVIVGDGQRHRRSLRRRRPGDGSLQRGPQRRRRGGCAHRLQIPVLAGHAGERRRLLTPHRRDSRWQVPQRAARCADRRLRRDDADRRRHDPARDGGRVSRARGRPPITASTACTPCSARIPETGERFHNLDTVTGGWGGSARGDGPGPFRSAAHGDVPDIPVEMQEALFPYRIEAKQIRTDSAGPGRHRGGIGVEKRYRFLARLLGRDEIRSRR